MSQDQSPQPPLLISSTLRIATWNVWANFGAWKERYALPEAELRRADPDVICLQEVWRGDGYDAAADLAQRLGYHHSAAVDWFELLKIESGAAILSRWEISRTDKLALPAEDGGSGALFQFAEVQGPRGPVLIFNAMLDWRPDLSHVRQAQVRQLCAWIRDRRIPRSLILLAGDFNAAPDSDEIRMITGKREAAQVGLVFYDAWEAVRPQECGWTWANTNPLTHSFPLPDRRIDFIFSAWGGRGGLGQPTAADLLSHGPDAFASDHYGVWADLRY